MTRRDRRGGGGGGPPGGPRGTPRRESGGVRGRSEGLVAAQSRGRASPLAAGNAGGIESLTAHDAVRTARATHASLSRSRVPVGASRSTGTGTHGPTRAGPPARTHPRGPTRADADGADGDGTDTAARTRRLVRVPAPRHRGVRLRSARRPRGAPSPPRPVPPLDPLRRQPIASRRRRPADRLRRDAPRRPSHASAPTGWSTPSSSWPCTTVTRVVSRRALDALARRNTAPHASRSCASTQARIQSKGHVHTVAIDTSSRHPPAHALGEQAPTGPNRVRELSSCHSWRS
jgi:hypothetical protein